MVLIYHYYFYKKKKKLTTMLLANTTINNSNDNNITTKKYFKLLTFTNIAIFIIIISFFVARCYNSYVIIVWRVPGFMELYSNKSGHLHLTIKKKKKKKKKYVQVHYKMYQVLVQYNIFFLNTNVVPLMNFTAEGCG